MTLDDIVNPLPWGLHDAYIENLAIDWLSQTLTLTARLAMSEHQDLDQRARITVEGLVFCAIDPPEIDPAHGYDPLTPEGLWINFGSGAANAESAKRLPQVPAGTFLNWMFVHSWNRFIHICGASAKLEWLEVAPVPARTETRALFPGDEVPDPA
jgi:hypothetical protein